MVIVDPPRKHWPESGEVTDLVPFHGSCCMLSTVSICCNYSAWLLVVPRGMEDPVIEALTRRRPAELLVLGDVDQQTWNVEAKKEGAEATAADLRATYN